MLILYFSIFLDIMALLLFGLFELGQSSIKLGLSNTSHNDILPKLVFIFVEVHISQWKAGEFCLGYTMICQLFV